MKYLCNRCNIIVMNIYCKCIIDMLQNCYKSIIKSNISKNRTEDFLLRQS